MAYVISDDCIACESTQTLVQNVVLVLMFVLLKLFIRDNIRSSIYDNEFRLFLFWSGLFLYMPVKYEKKHTDNPTRRISLYALMYKSIIVTILFQASQCLFDSTH